MIELSVLQIFTIFGAGYMLHWFKWLVFDGGIDKILKRLEEK